MKHATALILALATIGLAPAYAGESKMPKPAASSHMNGMMKKSMMPSCKGATVYAVPSTKTYYLKGTANYGHVKGGMYMCQAAANAKGYKAAKG